MTTDIPALSAAGPHAFTLLLSDLAGAAKRVTVSEKSKAVAVVGNFYEHDGKLWRIESVRHEADDDWFSDKIHLYLVGPDQEARRSTWDLKVSWLEDEFLPRLKP